MLACVRPLRGPVVLALVLAVAGAYLPGPPLASAASTTVVFLASMLAFRVLGADDVRLLMRVLRTPIDPSAGAA